MKSGADQIHSLAQDAVQQGSEPVNGASLLPHGHRWGGRLGGHAAKNRFQWYVANSGKLTPRQMVTLEVVSRLEITYMNVCSWLEKDGPVTVEGEPRALLSRALELQRAIRSGLAEVYGDGAEASDPIGDVVRGAR